ncbi:MAG TPA: NAD(P)H-dependent glycerol-3-phosphate dehydrogenase [Acidimicrobiales bacterium]|nr:NAD(P)H-dependent glycerol-3-phosphate dehydrogenase [Acidimicrobiales bacterium]
MGTRVAVLGAGSWGTTMAKLAGRRAGTTLWARRPELAAAINAVHRNPEYLPEGLLPPEVVATADMEEALAGASLVVMAVPSHGFRAIVEQARPHLLPGTPVLSLTKGLEEGSLKRMTEVLAELLPASPAGVLTGPNLAGEIMEGQPAASVVAMRDEALAAELQRLLGSERFRVYTNEDVVGCEIAGALKNVAAIASGMGDGMGFGDNSRAALITRGLAELTRLGTALGGQPLTFSGLAGLGDLVVTCISRRSRNRRVGEELGRGRTIDEVVAATNQVAEGVKTSRVVLDLAATVGVEMPIAEQVVAVIFGGKTPADALAALMHREAKPEHGPARWLFARDEAGRGEGPRPQAEFAVERREGTVA